MQLLLCAEEVDCISGRKDYSDHCKALHSHILQLITSYIIVRVQVVQASKNNSSVWRLMDRLSFCFLCLMFVLAKDITESHSLHLNVKPPSGQESYGGRAILVTPRAIPLQTDCESLLN